jgi:hypothetical protein
MSAVLEYQSHDIAVRTLILDRGRDAEHLDLTQIELPTLAEETTI